MFEMIAMLLATSIVSPRCAYIIDGNFIITILDVNRCGADDLLLELPWKVRCEMQAVVAQDNTWPRVLVLLPEI